jgi:trans-aconitate 2-methyltransferase
MTSPGHLEWDAATYDRVADPQARWGAAVLERLPLDGDETVLDAGCGSGRVTEQLLARLPRGRVVALDASTAMLARARLRLAASADRVSFVHADLLELGPSVLPGVAALDAVFSTATFHWVPDHSRLFRNLASVLRPGGRLVAQCGGEGNIAGLLRVVRSLGIDRAGTWEYASPATTAQRLREAGFGDIQTWTAAEPTRFDSGEQLHDFLEAVCLRESLAPLSAERRTEVVDAVVAAMPEPVLDYIRLNIVAIRRPASTLNPTSTPS